MIEISNRPSQLLIGDLPSLRATFDDKGSFLTFSPLKNTVVIVNSLVKYPLPLEVGKASPIAFFYNGSVHGDRKSVFNQYVLETHQEHHRSALLARAIFEDQKGRLYRDLDIKGIGYVHPTYGMTALPYNGLGYTDRLGRTFGFLSMTEAMLDYESSQRLLGIGVRSHAALAVAKLDEVVVDGNVVPVTYAREIGILAAGFIPVVEIRAFGTKGRIRDVLSGSYLSNALLSDAKKIVEQETDRAMTWVEYFQWFVATLGENLGRLHGANLSHNDITTQNVTLDCRLTDLHSVRRLTFIKGVNDLRFAWRTLSSLKDYLRREYDIRVLTADIFRFLNQGYQEGLKA